MKKIRLENIVYFILTIILLVFIFDYYFTDLEPSINISKEPLNGIKVSFLDVGQADSILIETEDKNMLIDAGNNEDGKLLVNYLKDKNIDRFDYVIGTHAHEDHIGGLDNIVKSFDIDNFYMPKTYADNMTYTEILNALNTKNIVYTTPSINDLFNFGEAKVKVVYIGDDTEELNNTSIVLLMTYKNVKFLFMGDLPSTIEDTLDDIDADVLKVSHHGSSSSTSDVFLDKVSPSYAIISCGRNNDYHYPSNKVLNRLKKHNTEILRTDELGTIVITSDGESINISNIDTNIDSVEYGQ